MSDDFVKSLLRERRQRAVGTIMSSAETLLFKSASPQVQRAFRDKVLEAFGAYHDVVLDCMKASVNDGSVGNDPALILAALRPELRAFMLELREDVRG
jgi:hypothetical protein